jgi:hypothetical protein
MLKYVAVNQLHDHMISSAMRSTLQLQQPGHSVLAQPMLQIHTEAASTAVTVESYLTRRRGTAMACHHLA